jgi:outer membrane protein, multidrug efflux system
MNRIVRFSDPKHRQRALAIAIACSLLLVLPSCIPLLRKPAPGPNLPERFNLRQADLGPSPPQVVEATSSENSAQVKVEEFFDDPMLLCLIHQALVNNQELRILNEDVLIASYEIMARQGAYLPFVTAGGGVSLNKFSSYTLEGAAIRDDPFLPGKFFPNPLPNFFLGPTFLWTPDIWRQLHNARDAAGMRYFATGEGRNYFVTQLIAEIADNYYGLIALDKRLENLDKIIALQEQNLRFAQAAKEAARGTELAVQRFLAEVRRNQSEKLIVKQDIIQVENRINFLVGRFPQPVERWTRESIDQFIDLKLHTLGAGVPAQLLQNRPDLRQAEREIAAAGLDVMVARKRFYPVMTITSGVGYEAFNMRYLFITPESLVANVAGQLVGPLINFKAIKADYLGANARQLQTVYNYQRVIINAVAEVVNRMSKVENYRNSIEIKKQAVRALQASVVAATSLFQNPRAGSTIDYLDVLTAQRELLESRRTLIDTKREQLSAIVNTYQALGGGGYLFPIPIPPPLQSHHWWKHSSHSVANTAVGSGPEPPPTPAAAPGSGSGPLPAPTPAPPSGPGPFPTPPAERGPVPPPTPPAETDLVPLPRPAAERGPVPLPTPM